MTVPVRTWRGSAAVFHARLAEDDPALEVWVFEVQRSALVLGSTQHRDLASAEACRRAGVEVVRRRSGGGAVLLEPGGIVWFDVVVPSEHLRAVGVGDDVGLAMEWLGDHVAAALTDLGVDGTEVHRGRMACSGWCPLVCFAGLGPGEVLVGGHKMVGISQRRTRVAARFQCAVHTIWSPEALIALLAPPLPDGAPPPVATLPADVARHLPTAVAATL